LAAAAGPGVTDLEGLRRRVAELQAAVDAAPDEATARAAADELHALLDLMDGVAVLRPGAGGEGSDPVG
jgi:hypothetical protein